MGTDEPGTSPKPAAPGGPRRRRRRRGRRGEHGPEKAGAEREKSTPETRSAGPGRGNAARGRPERGKPPRPAPPPEVVPTVSHLTESSPTGEPLTADEVVEMKQHLGFLREYKDALRLRLNAAEDLLVNGRREPSDRGVCRHLLGKVDRAVIDAAVGREPMKSNAPARARMLAGAIRLTADVGVLLAYLETLAMSRSHAEAAQAFAEVVRRIDFESLSATRLARLLQVLTETFAGQERVQVLFSLLDGDAFRRAFDAAEPMLPPEVAAVFAPLRAVHRRLAGETTPASASGGDASDRLAVGLEQVLAAPDPVLRGYAEPLRLRMLELALDPGIPAALADRAAGVLLTSLARTGKTFTRLAMRRASQLLARHVDDRARAVLEEVKRAAPGFQTTARWLGALDAKHMGRIALTASPPERGRLGAGFWLDGQRPVWFRTAPAGDAARLAAEAALQRTLALPGVAPVVEHGVASGIPYVAVLSAGRPFLVDAAQPEQGASLAFAAHVARLVRALALAGVTLPDAAPERFCITGDRTLTLADLDGAERVASEEAAAIAFTTAASAVQALLAPGVLAAEPLAAALTSGDLVALVQALDSTALHLRRDD